MHSEGRALAASLHCGCEQNKFTTDVFSGILRSSISREDFILTPSYGGENVAMWLSQFITWFANDWTFAVGAHKLNLQFSNCEIYAECYAPGLGRYHVRCGNNSFQMRDRFADPFDLQELIDLLPPAINASDLAVAAITTAFADYFDDVAGTPYNIKHDYSAPGQEVSGTVGQPKACPIGRY